MKFSVNTLFLFLGIVSLGIMQSCSDDNEDPNPSPSGPTTLTFSNIDNVEFKMWTNGAEVNTSGLSIADYMEPDTYDGISSEHFQSQSGLTFEGDSLFSEENGMIVGYPYHISNDSIFITLSFPLPSQDSTDIFIAVGDAIELYIPQKYYKTVVSAGNTTVINSVLGIGHYTFDELSNEVGLTSITDLQEGDTLILYNQRVNYN